MVTGFSYFSNTFVSANDTTPTAQSTKKPLRFKKGKIQGKLTADQLHAVIVYYADLDDGAFYHEFVKSDPNEKGKWYNTLQSGPVNIQAVSDKADTHRFQRTDGKAGVKTVYYASTPETKHVFAFAFNKSGKEIYLYRTTTDWKKLDDSDGDMQLPVVRSFSVKKVLKHKYSNEQVEQIKELYNNMTVNNNDAYQSQVVNNSHGIDSQTEEANADDE